MPYIIGGVLAATAIYGAIDASNRRKQAKQQIAKLKAMNVNRSPEDMLNEAKGVIKTGYSPEETANFNSSLIRGQNAAYRMSSDKNPNLSGAITSGLNFSKLGALNQFAANDAQLRRQQQQDYVSMLQRKTQNDVNNKRDQEYAYGQAKAQANADIYNSISQLGTSVAYMASSGIGGGGGGGSKTTTNPDQGTGSAFNGQAPLMSFQNPAPNYGSNAWAQKTYGGSYTPSRPPYFGVASPMTAPNQSTANPGSDQWGQDLYGNPTGNSSDFYQYPVYKTISPAKRF